MKPAPKLRWFDQAGNERPAPSDQHVADSSHGLVARIVDEGDHPKASPPPAIEQPLHQRSAATDRTPPPTVDLGAEIVARANRASGVETTADDQAFLDEVEADLEARAKRSQQNRETTAADAWIDEINRKALEAAGLAKTLSADDLRELDAAQEETLEAVEAHHRLSRPEERPTVTMSEAWVDEINKRALEAAMR